VIPYIDVIYIDSMATTRRTGDKPILNFVLEPVLLRRIEDFRFRRRFATRSAAVKFLIDYALRQNPNPKEKEDK